MRYVNNLGITAWTSVYLPLNAGDVWMNEKRTGRLRRIFKRVRGTFDRRAEKKEIEQERRAEEERRAKLDQRSGEERRSDEWLPASTGAALMGALRMLQPRHFHGP